VEFRKELPKTNVGKILRKQLKADEMEKRKKRDVPGLRKVFLYEGNRFKNGLQAANQMFSQIRK